MFDANTRTSWSSALRRRPGRSLITYNVFVQFRIDKLRRYRVYLKQQNDNYILSVLPVRLTRNKKKKTKVFISPNRSALLNTGENRVLPTPSTSATEGPNSSPQRFRNFKLRVPPFYTKNVYRFSAFNAV